MNHSFKTLLIVPALLMIFISAGSNVYRAQSAAQPLVVTANFQKDSPVSAESAIELTLDRDLQAGEKIAFVLDETELTGLFVKNDKSFVYDPKTLPLPIGNSTITVYLIDALGNWKEVIKFPLVVGAPKAIESPEKTPEKKDDAQKTTDLTAVQPEASPAPTPEPKKFGFEKLDFLPSFTIAIKSQPFQSNFPIENRPSERATSTDLTLTGSIKNEVKRGVFGVESNFDFAGSSFKEEALRFGTLGEKAPDIDLSSYLMNFQIAKAKFSYGHTSFGNNRHLVSSFSARGLSVNIPLGKRFDVTAGILNGTSIVGFGNFFGLSKVRHQVQGATLGIEFFPQRQNAMRLEVTGFNGYIQALSNVSEGRINDSERSRGFGLRFIASDKSERFKLEAGYAFSRSQNPQDSELDPDGNAVPIPPISRAANYVEASYQILKDVKLTATKNLNLSASFKHEYVEPLYKSLGASAGADRTAQDYTLDSSIGDITFQYGHSRFHDNLRNVASILKSLTRVNRFSVALPLTALIGKAEKPLKMLPRLAYSIDRTHQFGAGIPINGGFEIDPATIPDLVNTNQSFSSTWQFTKFNLEYRYNRSFADNRQTGSETADQIGWTHGVAVGLNPSATLGFTVGLNFESSNNLGTAQINRTKALTLSATWQPFKNATFSGNFSNSLAGDFARTSDSRNSNFDMQFAYNFNIEKSKFRKFGMQSFIRFADTFVRTNDFIFNVNNRTRTKIINAGLTFNFF